MSKFIFAFFFLSSLLLAETPEASATPSPEVPVAAAPAAQSGNIGPKYTGEAQHITNELEELFTASKQVNADGGSKARARNQIEGALDWEKISQMCLGPSNWKKQSAKNREQFKNLLKDVIVSTAYSRLDKFWTPETTYSFEKVILQAKNAEVPTKFTVNGQPFTIDYFFVKKGSKWLIYDISYEDLRYSQNINEQIDSFLREKPFSDLLDKLRKRRDELSADSSDKSKSG